MDKKIIRDIARQITKLTGVELGETKNTMIRARLSRRMVQLGYHDLIQYYDYFLSHVDTELKVLVSILTTHTTHFFREYSHFEYLEKHALPELVAELKARGSRCIRVWSAGCSAGHEVYSIAMFLDFHLKKIAPDFSYQILASDVDAESIERAQEGVYTWKELKEAPAAYLVGHWDKGTGDISNFVRAKKTIKNRCDFQVINLLHLSTALKPDTRFDLIFCRNVFIYFSSEVLHAVAKKMFEYLNPRGVMVLGMSESLMAAKDLEVEPIYPSIYSKVSLEAQNAAKLEKRKKAVEEGRLKLISGEKDRIRVLCVDDSPTVLSMLKEVLSEECGFEVAGTAANGEEAHEFLKKVTVDIVTLDIHMPVLDGVEYLRRYFNPTHPPVVIVSSVARDDSNLGIRALELGASDYVEKPSVSNFKEISDQIRTKLRFLAKTSRVWKMNLELENSFKRTPVIFEAKDKLRVVVAGIKDRDILLKVLLQMESPQPPTFVLFTAAESLVEAMKTQLKTPCFGEPRLLESVLQDSLVSDQIWIGSFSKWIGTLRQRYGKRKTSLLVFGDQSSDSIYEISQWKDSDILIEDLMAEFDQNPTSTYLELKKITTSISPVTSFSYLSCVYLCDRPKALDVSIG